MSTQPSSSSNLRRLLVGTEVIVIFVLLVGPLAVGAIDTDLMTPLALPGYLVLMLGSSIGNTLFPNFALWVYWAPFLMVSYIVSVLIASLYRALRHSN